MQTYSIGGNPKTGDIIINNSIQFLTEKLDELQTEFTNLLHNQTGGMRRLFSSDSSSSEPESLYKEHEKLALEDLELRKKTGREFAVNPIDDDMYFMPIDESPMPLLPKISPISETQIQDGIVHLENGNILKVYNDLLEFNESRELYEKLEGVPELLSYYVKPITWNSSELSCEMEKFGESISNRLRSKKPLEGEDDKLFYLDDNFDEVAYWLRDVLEKLHKNDLYHGDILGNGNFHIGNIVCKLVDGNWVYKLIDFGDKLGKTKDSHIIYGVDKTELDLMSGKIKEEILLKKLFTNEGKYTPK